MSQSKYQQHYASKEPLVPYMEEWQSRYCYLNKNFKDIRDRLENFEVRSDDVWIVTLPKVGTTWIQEMTWLILNDYDFEKAKSKDISERSPFIE